MNRKSFLKKSLLGGLGISTFPALSMQTDLQEQTPLKVALVKEFVLAGHFNLDKVKSMLEDYPNLIYSRFDWGNGDFEEAIEGAGHKGNKEVANFLIDKGARVNLFVLTMLGKTQLVKPVLDSYPNLLFSKGPHGLSLLHHAEQGGSDSKELYEYLIEKGLTKKQFDIK